MVSDAGDASGVPQVKSEAIRLARAIKGCSTSLLDVVETMGPALNSEKLLERTEALDTLAQLLTELPAGLLTEAEISLLLGYFVAQLKGHHPETARIAMRALHTMFVRYKISSGDAVRFVEGFFNEVALVDLTRDDKMILYRIFQRVLSNDAQRYLDAVGKQMSSAVMPGFLQLIELETDPQCLLICFDMFQTVVKNIPLGVYVDDMFEYPAGYFPIDFQGSPDRHGGVTRTQLQESLEACLLAHSSFSQHVIKLCLEKISSDVRQAQIDALKLLRRAVEQYECSVCYKYFEAIWPLLRKLYVAHREDSQLEEGILRLTAVLAQKLGDGEDGDAKLEQFANIIWKDFEDREAFLECSGWRFVVAFAGGSSRSLNKILPKAFAKVTRMIADENQISSSLLDASCAMLQVFIGLHKSADESKVLKVSFGTTIFPAIEMLVGQACTLLLEPSCSKHLVKLIGLIEVALTIEDALNKSQLDAIRRFIELCIVQKSLKSSPTAAVSSVILKRFVAACSTFFGQSFTADLLLLAKQYRCVWLLASLIQRGDGPSNNAKDICFELFSIGGSEAFAAIREIVLSYPAETTSSVLEKLLSIQELSRKDVEEYEDLLTVAIREASTHYGQSAIQSILVGLQRQLSASSNAALNMPLLQLRVVLSNCPCCCLTEQLGSELVGTLLKLAPTIKTHSEENLERVLENDPNRSEPLNTSPSAFEDSTNLIWRCVALLANKHIENSETEWAVISGVLERCTAGDDEASIITKTQCNDTRKQSGTDTLKIVYLAKGLLLRGHRRCEEALSVALKNASQSIDGAKNFAIISRPEPKIFPREGHCAVRLLYPQRLLTFAVPRLIELFHNGNDAERLNISVAILSTIQHVSADIAEPYLSKLGTVILWCLSQPSFPPESSQGLVQCLRQSLSQLKLSVGHLLPALLRWSQRPASMNLRIEAMGCLLDLRSYFQVHELLPYKRTVLREMPVGDRKRLVRKAASTTALAWHMLGEASK
ncbi:MMS19 nucleotide excision repair protein homolog [Varroa jacobsoni]|uniref:MMS19 nucleotide excision repair protein homolog n=1 Tax=Varroa jacobsoni TaxID=62625 RepID=UPI000BF6592E|nr:MMS19 nucleotide excision repair protein homolog [Varroa jacobsoni]XP_022695080.1 MMS19 nucleotide excision repair protein homolog [Varroa jacobsoni]